MVHYGALCVKRIVRHMCAMARDDPHLRLRIPESLKDQVEASAKANNRSMNAEIISRLERSFDVDDGLVGLETRVANIEENETETYRRLEELERQISTLQEVTGMVDPNGWKD